MNIDIQTDDDVPSVELTLVLCVGAFVTGHVAWVIVAIIWLMYIMLLAAITKGRS